MVEHLLPFCHHVPLKVAKGLLAWEGDLEELWELSGQMLVEEKEVAVSAQNLPPCFFPPDSQDIVDKLFAGAILSSQVDVLDLRTKLTQLTIATSASNASIRAGPP